MDTTTHNDRSLFSDYKQSTVGHLSCIRNRNGRQARVWLAKRIVGLKKVEIGLTSRVSELADRLASSDDSQSVSAVFGQVSFTQQ